MALVWSEETEIRPVVGVDVRLVEPIVLEPVAMVNVEVLLLLLLLLKLLLLFLVLLRLVLLLQLRVVVGVVVHRQVVVVRQHLLQRRKIRLHSFVASR